VNNTTRQFKKKAHEYSIQILKKKVAKTIDGGIETVDDLQRFLANWWCRYYNKPYNSKEILDYTLDELLIEYLELSYFQDARQYRKESDIEEPSSAEEDADEEWLKKQMGKDYITIDNQEEALKGSEAEIDAALENPDGEFTEHHVVFEDN
jgi:hypothetical protein